jgi:hypothetical protein
MFQLTRTRKMPYRIGIHWFQVALYSTVTLILVPVLISGFREGQPGTQFRVGLANRHFVILWADLVFLLFILFVFVRDIFWKIAFSDSEIEYHFFWVHRRFRYDDLQSIRPLNNYNLTACFRFRDGSEFKYPLAYYDADYLLEILKERSPSVLPELAALRNALTPHDLRTAQ